MNYKKIHFRNVVTLLTVYLLLYVYFLTFIISDYSLALIWRKTFGQMVFDLQIIFIDRLKMLSNWFKAYDYMKKYLICCVQRCLFLFQIHFWDWPWWQVHWYVCDRSGSVWGGSKYYLFVFASWWFFPHSFAWFMMTFVGARIKVTETDWFMMWYHVEIFLLCWLQKTILALQEALCSRVGKCPCMSIMTSLSYGQKNMFFTLPCHTGGHV